MIVIDKLTESEIPVVAPLVAQFRVTLKSFRGISSVPDEAGGAAELKEYLDAGFPVYTARADGTYCGTNMISHNQPQPNQHRTIPLKP